MAYRPNIVIEAELIEEALLVGQCGGKARDNSGFEGAQDSSLDAQVLFTTQKRARNQARRLSQSERPNRKPGQRQVQKAYAPDEQRAEIERVDHEHGADLSKEGFNEASRTVEHAKCR